MKPLLIAGALALASTGLGACGTLGALPLTGNPAADAKTAASNLAAVNGNLQVINQQLMAQIVQHCGFKGALNISLPNPVPTGNLAMFCDIEPGGLTAPTTLGLSATAIGMPSQGQGGTFGGGGATASAPPPAPAAAPAQ